MKKILMDNIKKIAGAAVIILIAVAAYLYSETLKEDTAEYTFAAQTSDETQTEEASASPAPAPVSWKAHIAGEVKNPGVYDINEETRLLDLIEMAGGLSDKADMSAVNLALKIADQQKVNIPAISEQPSGEPSGTPAPSVSIVEDPAPSVAASVNINTAGLSELMTLPGVGEVTAKRIIDYRDANGAFKTADELLFVDGIGEVTLSRMRDMLIVP